MAQQAALSMSRFQKSATLLDSDIPVRNTFIHFDDRLDDEDTLPAFSRHTRSSPAEIVAANEPVAFEEKALAVARLGADLDYVNSDLEFFFAVKNTFIHLSDDEDESLPPMRRCKTELCGGEAAGLEALRAGLSGLLSESAKPFEGKRRGAGSFHSSCSTSPSPSAGRRSKSHGTAATSSDSTDVGEAPWSARATDAGEEALDLTDDSSNCGSSSSARPRPLAPADSELASLETRGATLEAHQAGNCQPCFYFNFKADGCRKGADCIYCHFCSSQESKQRKRTTKTLAKKLKRAYAAGCCC